MNDAPYIKNIKIVGLHGHQDLFVKLKPGLNIVHGKNGTGKTTLLHIIANIAEQDIQRFRSLSFKSITVTTNTTTIKLDSVGVTNGEPAINLSIGDKPGILVGEGEQFPDYLIAELRFMFQGYPVYLPAFRSILEAASERTTEHRPRIETDYSKLIAKETERLENEDFPPYAREKALAVANKTNLCRRWFGDFVPVIRYPSISDVEAQLRRELDLAHFKLSQTDQKTLSTVFNQVLEAVLRQEQPRHEIDYDQLRQRVRDNLTALTGRDEEASRNLNELLSRPDFADSVEPNIANILDIYDRALQNRADQQKAAFKVIQKFEQSVNQFLEKKMLHITGTPRRRPSFIKLIKQSAGLDVLSSGERHVLTLLFCTTHMAKADGIVLIDEPELSLHVDWQRMILGEIMKQSGSRQIIACTHAPEVAADHPGALTVLQTTESMNDATLFNEEENGRNIE